MASDVCVYNDMLGDQLSGLVAQFGRTMGAKRANGTRRARVIRVQATGCISPSSASPYRLTLLSP